MQKILKLIFIILISWSIACSSDEGVNTDNNGELVVGNFVVNFNNIVGEQDLVLQQETYNKSGDESISVSELKYIISNIVLIDANGNEFVYPQEDSYFLINEEVNSSQRLTLQNVNANNYTSIRFGIGVDQSKYPLNGIQNFVPTAEENNMLWSWSAGYIFMRIEGLYSSLQSTDVPFRLHIGSHGQNLDNYKEVSLNFLQPLALSDTETPEININFDVLKLFTGQHEMLLEDKDDIQIDPENAPKITENYVSAFEIGMN
jgi:hypothetical protein